MPPRADAALLGADVARLLNEYDALVGRARVRPAALKQRCVDVGVHPDVVAQCHTRAELLGLLLHTDIAPRRPPPPHWMLAGLAVLYLLSFWN